MLKIVQISISAKVAKNIYINRHNKNIKHKSFFDDIDFSFYVKIFYVKNNKLYALIKICDNPQGNILKKLLKYYNYTEEIKFVPMISKNLSTGKYCTYDIRVKIKHEIRSEHLG